MSWLSVVVWKKVQNNNIISRFGKFWNMLQEIEESLKEHSAQLIKKRGDRKYRAGQYNLILI